MAAYKPTGGLAPGEVPPPPGLEQQHQGGINDKRLYIGNLSWDFNSEDKLMQFLVSRGLMSMTEVRLPMDKESGLPRGFAFVSFPTAADADRALEALDQTSDGHGRQIDVRRSFNHNPAGGGGRGAGGAGGGGSSGDPAAPSTVPNTIG